MKPDFSDYIIAVLLELDDGLPHSMDQCVDGVYDKCDIEYEIPLIGHYLKKEDVYYTSVKTAIVMLKLMVSLRLIMTIMQCSPEKVKDILK